MCAVCTDSAKRTEYHLTELAFSDLANGQSAVKLQLNLGLIGRSLKAHTETVNAHSSKGNECFYTFIML